jgi:hypothetical protein
MKKLLLSLTLLFVCQISILAQEIDENKTYLYKYNGDVIYTNYIEYKTPFLKKNYLKYEDNKINTDEVKFYNTESGFFMNIKGLGSGFAERIIKGRINFFEQANMVTTSQPMNGGFGMPMGTSTSTVFSYFYNKGIEQPKRATYDNLIVDLADNPKSVVYLNNFKTAKSKRNIWYVVGGIAMVAGILTAAEKTGEYSRGYNHETGRVEDIEKTELKPVNLVIGLAGFATIITTYLKSRKKKDYIRESILIYNE